MNIRFFSLFSMLQLVVILARAQAGSYSAYTSYTWDEWQANYTWKYEYSNGWAYAYPSLGGQPRDFYFRFKYKELGLHHLHGQEWKNVKANNKWFETSCTFEYYVTDEYPTLRASLEDHSWPCAKRFHYDKDRPIVLKSTKAKVSAKYDDDDEVRALNFWIDGVGFAITVHWDYSGYNMTYTY